MRRSAPTTRTPHPSGDAERLGRFSVNRIRGGAYPGAIMQTAPIPHRRRIPVMLLSLAAALFLFGSVVHGEEAWPRGLVVQFVREDLRDARIARLPVLRVPAGESPTPFLAPGPFQAIFEGFIEIEFIDDYTFFLSGRGKARLEIDGKLVLEASGDLRAAEAKSVELDSGQRPLRLEYTSPATGEAHVQLDWSSFDFVREPVSPLVVAHDPSGNSPAMELLRRGETLRRGRSLVASRRCLGCHRSEALPAAMPELHSELPRLDGITQRLQPDWLARWIAQPTAARHSATMPQVFDASAASQRADDIVAYLLSLSDGLPVRSSRPLTKEARENGAALFDKIGCVACHLPPGEAPDGGDDDRLALDHVDGKWRSAALVEFLLMPTRHYPAIAMPNFRLSGREAIDLAAYLIPAKDSGAATTTRDRPKSDPAAGRKSLEESGCLGCHELSGHSNRLAAPPFAALTKLSGDAASRGCLAERESATGAAPWFGFSIDERQSLQAFLGLQQRGAHPLEMLRRDSDVEYAQRRIETLRCNACHGRDGVLDQWSSREVGDPAGAPIGVREALATSEPELLQTRPRLTWSGEKLHADWLAVFLSDRERPPLRPWLEARMPAFALDAQRFARGLALQHGVLPERSDSESVANSLVDAEAVRVGEKLVAKDGGFACNTCHSLAGVEAEGVFDAKGPDLAGIPLRLRKSFYHRWMLNPLRLSPGTKMPEFASEGRSPYGEYYDGDAAQQFEALWQLFLTKAPEFRRP